MPNGRRELVGETLTRPDLSEDCWLALFKPLCSSLLMRTQREKREVVHICDVVELFVLAQPDLSPYVDPPALLPHGNKFDGVKTCHLGLGILVVFVQVDRPSK